jgi:hypothetical protein
VADQHIYCRVGFDTGSIPGPLWYQYPGFRLLCINSLVTHRSLSSLLTKVSEDRDFSSTKPAKPDSPLMRAIKIPAKHFTRTKRKQCKRCKQCKQYKPSRQLQRDNVMITHAIGTYISQGASPGACLVHLLSVATAGHPSCKSHALCQTALPSFPWLPFVRLPQNQRKSL